MNYCNALIAAGQPVNMIVAIASLQSLIELEIQEFLKVDRPDLKNLEAAAYWSDTPLTYAVVIAKEAHKIPNIMDASITSKITEIKHLKISIIVVFSISLLIVNILVWLYILKVIREVHNDFKKVLQTFRAKSVFIKLPFEKIFASNFIWTSIQKNMNSDQNLENIMMQRRCVSKKIQFSFVSINLAHNKIDISFYE